VSEKTITEKAFDLGFSSSQSFATAFRRLTNHRLRDVRGWHRLLKSQEASILKFKFPILQSKLKEFPESRGS
jgi:AraC-like DNA-binding protein